MFRLITCEKTLQIQIYIYMIYIYIYIYDKKIEMTQDTRCHWNNFFKLLLCKFISNITFVPICLAYFI